MTANTGLGADGAVIKGQDYPCLGVMTYFARFGGGYMQCALARGNDPIMTTGAGAEHFIVIHNADEWNPAARGGMTGVAIIRRIDVRGGFADGYYAIVATDAGADDFVVIYRRGHDWDPRYRGQVTSLA